MCLVQVMQVCLTFKNQQYDQSYLESKRENLYHHQATEELLKGSVIWILASGYSFKGVHVKLWGNCGNKEKSFCLTKMWIRTIEVCGNFCHQQISSVWKHMCRSYDMTHSPSLAICDQLVLPTLSTPTSLLVKAASIVVPTLKSCDED